eukprot:jgi/Astpho2/906/Aster-x0461
MTSLLAVQPGHATPPAVEMLHKLGALPAVAGIAPDLVHKAKGLVFMSTYKAGVLYVGVQKGSGFIVGKTPDGAWSGPSFFDWHAAGGGLTLGVSKADTVMVLNTEAALEQFKRDTDFKLGADIKPNEAADSVTGDSLKAKLTTGESDAFVFTWAGGLLFDLTVTAGVTTPAARENAKVYGQSVSPTQILGGQLPPPPQAQPLYDALHQMSAGRAGMAGQPAY